MVTLYPFQGEAFGAITKSWDNGKKTLLVAIPTGGGKTVLFSSIARQQLEGNDKRCLILAHRDTLLDQADEKMHYVWPEIETSRVMAGKYDFSARVIIASKDTLVNHLEDLPKVDLVITDEAHHAYASQYRKIYKHVYGVNPDCRHLGVTATPVRMNKKESLRDVFEELTYSISIFRLIMEGYLLPIEGYSIDTALDLSKVNTRGDDYELKQLSEAVQAGDFNETVANTFKKKAAGRTAVCFAVDAGHVEKLTELFRQNGITAAGLHWKVSKEEQKQILRRFRNGEYQALINCMIVTEGFDYPPTDCIVMARPTKSIGLYTQMLGRGLRTSPLTGKKECLLLDFVGSSESSGLITLKDLLSFYEMRKAATILKDVATEDTPLRLDPRSIKDIEVIDELGDDAASSGALTSINLFDVNDYAWGTFDGNSYVALRKEITLAIILESSAGDEDRFNVYLCQSNKENKWHSRLNTAPVTFTFALAICNVYLYDYGDKALANKDANWRKEPPSEGQVKYFRSMFASYKRMVPGTKLTNKDFVTAGDYSNMIDAAKTLIGIRNTDAIERDTAIVALGLRVAREMSVIPFDAFSKLPWEGYEVSLKGVHTPEVVNKVKQMAAYFHRAYADGFPFQFFSGSIVDARNGTITINRDRYPLHQLTTPQRMYLTERIYPVARSLFPKQNLVIVG